MRSWELRVLGDCAEAKRVTGSEVRRPGSDTFDAQAFDLATDVCRVAIAAPDDNFKLRLRVDPVGTQFRAIVGIRDPNVGTGNAIDLACAEANFIQSVNRCHGI